MPWVPATTVFTLLLHIVLSFGPKHALADRPLPNSDQYAACSDNNKYCAVIDKLSGVNVYKVSKRANLLPIWKIPKKEWRGFLPIFITNDGHYLIEGVWNLIPINPKKSMPMIRAYKEGTLKYSLLLKDLIQDIGELERTTSHLSWGFIKGPNEKGQLIIETIEGKRLTISIETGEIIKRETSKTPYPSFKR